MSTSSWLRKRFSPSFAFVAFLALGVLALWLPAGAEKLPRNLSISEVHSQPALETIDRRKKQLEASNLFGIAGLVDLNQAGDYAFIGALSSAVFLRPAGTGIISRIFQMGDPVPGVSGSRADVMSSVRLNSSGKLVFVPQINATDGFPQSAILLYDGNSVQKLVASKDVAPGSGGIIYGRTIVLGGLNDSGDVAFSAPVTPLAGGVLQTTVFIVPNGGAASRIAGPGDPAPGTGGGTMSNVSLAGGVNSLNNSGEVLFFAQIVGGSGGFGMFAGSTLGVRKIVANGDANPLGGNFSILNGLTGRLNNSGQTLFVLVNTIWTQAAGPGISKVVAVNDTLPAPVGGTISSAPQLATFNDAGAVAFLATINAGAGPRGVFRFTPPGTLQTVAFATQSAPGAGASVFSGFGAISINNNGLVSFQSNLINGTIAGGIFQQSGVGAPVKVALEGEAAPLSGGSAFSVVSPLATRALDNGSTYFSANLIGAGADYGEFISTGGAVGKLMTNADSLPSGSRTSVRTFRVGAAGDYVGFLGQQTGGRVSIMVRNVLTDVTTTAVTDGDGAPGTPGGRLRIGNLNTVFVNSSGTVVFPASIIGGPLGISSGIFTASAAGLVTRVVADGDIDPNTGTAFSILAINFLAPSPINNSGQVVFRGNIQGRAGIYVASPGGGIARLVQNTDVAPGGGSFGNNAFNLNSFNSAGQVAFQGFTSGGPGQNQGVFIAAPGVPVAKIAVSGDSVPGGGTFFAFPTMVSLNDSGEVAFIGLVNSGANGGAFVGTTSGLQALALNGGAAPGGGNFSFPNTSTDILVNNQHDIAFRAALTAGVSNSAYFLRRGSGGNLQRVAAQGEVAPGAGTFFTIQATSNQIPGDFFGLGPTGELAFLTAVDSGNGPVFSAFRLRTDNLLERVVARGAVLPGTGGGTFLAGSQGFGTGSAGHFAYWGTLLGGTIDDEIFVTKTATGFGISGQVKDVNGVGIAGVNVALTGSVTGSTTTDNGGNYSFLNLTDNGNYTVTPTASTLSFTPSSQIFNNLSSDRIANFVATQTIVSVSGKATDANSNALGDIGITLRKNGAVVGVVMTNSQGNYSFDSLTAGADYMVSAFGSFTPISQSFSNLTLNAIADFKSGPSIATQCNTLSFAPAIQFTASTNPFSVAVGDFNADGRLDLAVTNTGTTTVSIFLGTGTGSFSAATNFTVGTNPRSVAVGDFNGDSKLDLAVSSNLSNVSILIGAGDGSFGAASTFAVGPNPEAVVVADFNADGKLDLAIANFSSNNVSILLGTGTGSFNAATNFAADVAPNSIAVGDVNGDGRLDLAVANVNSSNVSILLGTGTGSFSAPTNFQAGTGSRSVALGDLNGDGKLDLAVANESVPTVSILIGTGSGTFSAATNFPAGAQPSSIAVADFNGDGKLDVAVNNPGANVSILLGNGTGSLTSTTDFFSGSAPFSVAVGDFNGDGKGDLAVANFSSNNVSVLLNNGSTCNAQSSLSISGRVSDSRNNSLPDVTVTLSGPVSRVTQSDSSGNYSFANLIPGGNYTLTVQSNYFVFAPSRVDFFNFSSNQVANFTAAPSVVPSPTPTPSDNFDSPTRDATKWTIGTQTSPANAFDPQVTTTQVNGQLVITPVTQAVGMHYNGYVSANSFDLRNGKASVELVKAATGGADTIFSVGSDADNFYRFMVHTPGGPTPLAPTAKNRDGIESLLDTTTAQLVFQVKVNGVITSLSIAYDPMLHRFMRFRHAPEINSILFETSPDAINYTVQNSVLLQKGVSALTAELSAGTSNPTNPGTAVFDNFGLVTSTFQFSAASYTAGEGDGQFFVTVTRSGSTTDAGAVDFATADGTARQKVRYVNAAGTLSFAPGETSKTFRVLLEDNVIAEGDQALNLLLSNPVGGGLNSPGRALLNITDNDTTVPIGNPLDDPVFFVKQHYFDFLSRVADSGGLAFWAGEITQCGSNQTCIKNKRVDVSNAFFYELEYQQTGTYVVRLYRAAYGNNQPLANPNSDPNYPNEDKKLVSYAAFSPDRARVKAGSQLAQTQLELATAFVQRAEFVAKYPLSLATGAQFVDAVLATIQTDSGVNLQSQRQALMDLFNQGANANAGRAQVLYRLADDNVSGNPINNRTLVDAEYNRAFVLTQYFGYLRRNPDLGGFTFWLGQVNAGALRDGNKQHGMVCSFITSAEYQQRFSSVVTRNNGECQ